MAKNKFLESLVKIASPLFSSSMSDRYDHASDSDDTSFSLDGLDGGDVSSVEYNPEVDRANLWKLRKEHSKFHTAAPATANISPKSFDYLAWSKPNDFSSVAPFIVQHESGGEHTISKEPNKDGTHDYGYYQINDLNLDRKTSGNELANLYDPIFDNYTNFEAKICFFFNFPAIILMLLYIFEI